jgi:hypothetical protein
VPTYSRAGQFTGSIPGAPVETALRVLDAAGSDAMLWRDASRNKLAPPTIYVPSSGTVSFFADPGVYTVKWTGGQTTVTVTGGVQDTPAGADTSTADLLDVGEETIPRNYALSGSVTVSTGTLRLTFFTARKSETTTQVRVMTGGTAAAATPTLCRLGLYQIDGTAATLVASTANDTTLFAATNTAYTRSWSTPFSKIAGQRYAFGVLVVSGAATPAFFGQVVSSGPEALMSPALAGFLSAQADLTAAFSTGSLTSTGNRIYGAILP